MGVRPEERGRAGPTRHEARPCAVMGAGVAYSEFAMAKKKTSTRSRGRKRAAPRELLDTGSDTRYVRRGARGRFKESDDVGKALTRDRATKAKKKTKSGQGDRGDRKRA